MPPIRNPNHGQRKAKARRFSIAHDAVRAIISRRLARRTKQQRVEESIFDPQGSSALAVLTNKPFPYARLPPEQREQVLAHTSLSLAKRCIWGPMTCHPPMKHKNCRPIINDMGLLYARRLTYNEGAATLYRNWFGFEATGLMAWLKARRGFLMKPLNVALDMYFSPPTGPCDWFKSLVLLHQECPDLEGLDLMWYPGFSLLWPSHQEKFVDRILESGIRNLRELHLDNHFDPAVNVEMRKRLRLMVRESSRAAFDANKMTRPSYHRSTCLDPNEFF